MADQERKPCLLHPSLKSFCGCQKGTAQNPKFTLREGTYEGNPVVEIFKNGGPIHRFDEHFRFGIRKAQMFVACLAAIHEFCYGSDDERYGFKPRVIQEGTYPAAIRVSVEMHPNFNRSTGEFVDEPYLKLEALNGSRVEKGIGVMKCRAIWALREELGEWIGRAESDSRGSWCRRVA